MTVYNGELSKECVTLPFSSKINLAENKITGDFYTFGHHEDNPQAHRIIMYAWMKNGKKYYYGGKTSQESQVQKNETEERFNVTNQIHGAPNKRHVHIVIDGLPFPDSIPGGGYNPSVDDWANVYHDIIM